MMPAGRRALVPSTRANGGESLDRYERRERRGLRNAKIAAIAFAIAFYAVIVVGLIKTFM